jgi:cysteine-rich repeat protein
MLWRTRLVLAVSVLGAVACAKDPAACGDGCAPSDLDAGVADVADGAPSEVGASDLQIADIGRLEASSPVCGDTIQQFPEECDDGNVVSNDGCSADCKVEQQRCVPPSSAAYCDTRPVTCGDGVVVAAEACDDGNAAGGDGCAADCLSVEPGWHCRVPGKRCVPVCGDRILAGGETCDDGNTLNGDGCSSTCLLESGVARCGDGVISGAEECDDGSAGLGDAYGGCTSGCLIGAHCGDGQVDLPFEECDLGPDNTTIYGPVGCTSTCHAPPACGDAKVQSAFAEQCDDGPRNGTPGSACDRSCHLIID